MNIARLQSFVEGKWKTHQALRVTLPRSLRRFFTRSLTTSPMKNPPIDRNSVFPTSWSECVNLSTSSHFRDPDRSLPGYPDPDLVLSQKLALEYKRWSCASETVLMSTCGIEAEEISWKSISNYFSIQTCCPAHPCCRGTFC